MKEQIERWANFVKNHDYLEWKLPLKEFIDAQITKSNKFYRKLSKTKEGREKIREILRQKI